MSDNGKSNPPIGYRRYFLICNFSRFGIINSFFYICFSVSITKQNLKFFHWIFSNFNALANHLEIILFFFSFLQYGVQTQGLTLARQVFYHLQRPHPWPLFAFIYFSDRVCVFAQAAWDHEKSVSGVQLELQAEIFFLRMMSSTGY
jgi:hypothetical protein